MPACMVAGSKGYGVPLACMIVTGMTWELHMDTQIDTQTDTQTDGWMDIMIISFGAPAFTYGAPDACV
jgi:hypothetical protein